MKIVHHVSIQHNRKWHQDNAMKVRIQLTFMIVKKCLFHLDKSLFFGIMNKVLWVEAMLAWSCPRWMLIIEMCFSFFFHMVHFAMVVWDDGFIYHFIDTVFISRKHLKCVWREWRCFFNFPSEISVKGERHSKSECISLRQEMVVSAHMYTKRMKKSRNLWHAKL